MTITERHIEMISPEGFDRLFDREVNDYYTKKEAFWALNEEYKKAFGKYRYSNYESYRQSRRQRIGGNSMSVN